MANPPSPLAKLIGQLATDPQALQNFRQNPDAVMKAAGLTPVEVAAMKSKDPATIHEALGGEDGVAQMEQFVIRNATVIII